jgi:hypothetical protein
MPICVAQADAAEHAARLRMEPVAGILLFTIDCWSVTCCIEIGYRQWSMPFVKAQADAAECSLVENGACG